MAGQLVNRESFFHSGIFLSLVREREKRCFWSYFACCKHIFVFLRKNPTYVFWGELRNGEKKKKQTRMG